MPCKIEAESAESTYTLFASGNTTLMDVLQQADIPVNTACHGRGTCGKCVVQLTRGFLPVTSTDREHLTAEQTQAGFRLSCQSRPKVNCAVQVPTQFNLQRPSAIQWKREPKREFELIGAVDLGTTNVDFSFLDANTGEEVCVTSCLNRQIKRGYDVMTRLTYGIQGEEQAKELQAMLVETFNRVWREVSKQSELQGAKVSLREWNVAGNSCMTSALWRQGLFELSQAPYQTTFKEMRTGILDLLEPSGVLVTTFPLLGSFVGGDTSAAILAVGLDQLEGPTLLIDIGTNVELVLKYKEDLYICSTPAGPAFEGGNISIGMRAEPGAIVALTWNKGSISYNTIGFGKPRGICGTGLVQGISALVSAGVIAEDGAFVGGSEAIQLAPGLLLTQGDIREFQLAKGALSAGVSLLLEHAGVSLSDLREILIVGSFGEGLDVEAAMKIGMLPDFPVERYCKLGNMSLAGVRRFSREREVGRLEAIGQKVKLVELALKERFQDVFVNALNFRSGAQKK